jgi:DNA-damage-inducible protein J
MHKAEIIRVRVETSLKVEAEAVLAQLGLSPTEAIRLFYLQVSLQGGLPFEVRIPNAEPLRVCRRLFCLSYAAMAG